jgi:parvulin-like peptidyl-prolyl isomerase
MRAAQAGAAVLAAASVALSASAQTGGGSASPVVEPGQTANPQSVGKPDPNVRKPVAIVNGVVITDSDVEQRMAMVMTLNRLQLTVQQRDELRQQVLQRLIDETLEILDARSNEIRITDEAIDRAYEEVARRFAKTPADFTNLLRENGSSEYSIKRQIEAEIAWNSVVEKQVDWQSNVGDAEKKPFLGRQEHAKDTEQHQAAPPDPRDARLSLRQLTIRFPSGTSQAQAAAHTAEFARQTSALRRCGDVPTVAKALNAELVDNDQIRVRDLPPQLQDILLKLEIGHATAPFGSVQDGTRVLVLCGRDEAAAASPPSPNPEPDPTEVRMRVRAQQMLRDLRQDAVIEYR